MKSLELWFSDKNAMWRVTHLYNPIFALQRLLYPDVYTQLVVIGWIQKQKSLPLARKVCEQIFETCALIANEWRQQLNLVELKEDFKEEKKITLKKCLSFYNDNEIENFVVQWLSPTKDEPILPNLNILTQSDDHDHGRLVLISALHCELQGNSTKRVQNRIQNLNLQTMQLQLWRLYNQSNTEKWFNFVQGNNIPILNQKQNFITTI